MQTFFQNGDEQINGDGAPDLGAHRVGAGAIKGFDAQMLLDPFEEEFDLPAAPIQLRDGQRRDGEVVGQKDQRLARFWIAITDATQRDGIIVLGGKLRSNRYLDYPGYAQKGHRTTANLYLTLLHLAGATRDTFGTSDPNLKDIDTHGPLTELLA